MPLYHNNDDNINGWEYKSIKIDHRLAEVYNFARLNLAVLEVFEVQKDKLMVCCTSNREVPHVEGKPINDTYILDVLANTITESPHNIGSYHEFQVDRYLIGSCHMVRTFYFREGVPQLSPVYYFSNNTFKVISK